jgi:hypothetical protein
MCCLWSLDNEKLEPFLRQTSGILTNFCEKFQGLIGDTVLKEMFDRQYFWCSLSCYNFAELLNGENSENPGRFSKCRYCTAVQVLATGSKF